MLKILKKQFIPVRVNECGCAVAIRSVVTTFPGWIKKQRLGACAVVIGHAQILVSALNDDAIALKIALVYIGNDVIKRGVLLIAGVIQIVLLSVKGLQPYQLNADDQQERAQGQDGKPAQQPADGDRQ